LHEADEPNAVVSFLDAESLTVSMANSLLGCRQLTRLPGWVRFCEDLRIRQGQGLWRCRQASIASHGHPRQTNRSTLALAERLRRKTDRIDPTRMRRPCDHLGRGALTVDSASLKMRYYNDLRTHRSFDKDAPPGTAANCDERCRCQPKGVSPRIPQRGLHKCCWLRLWIVLRMSGVFQLLGGLTDGLGHQG
jgi:hypothetical protein